MDDTNTRSRYGELKASLLKLHAEHPEWTCKEMAEALDRDMFSVRSAAHDYGIKFRRACRERLPDRVTRSVNLTREEYESLVRDAKAERLSLSALMAKRLFTERKVA